MSSHSWVLRNWTSRCVNVISQSSSMRSATYTISPLSPKFADRKNVALRPAVSPVVSLRRRRSVSYRGVPKSTNRGCLSRVHRPPGRTTPPKMEKMSRDSGRTCAASGCEIAAGSTRPTHHRRSKRTELCLTDRDPRRDTRRADVVALAPGHIRAALRRAAGSLLDPRYTPPAPHRSGSASRRRTRERRS